MVRVLSPYISATSAPLSTARLSQHTASGNSPLQGGRRLIRAVRDSGGAAMAVSDDEILAAMVDLGHEGIGAEPSSASTVAAFTAVSASSTPMAAGAPTVMPKALPMGAPKALFRACPPRR